MAFAFSPQAYPIYAFIAVLFLLLRNRFRKGLSDIPGPALAKYTRLWKLHNVWKGDHHNTAIALHREHGHLVRIGPTHISVGDPKAIPIIYGLNKGFTKVIDILAHSYDILAADIIISLFYVRRPSIQSSVSRGTKSLK